MKIRLYNWETGKWLLSCTDETLVLLPDHGESLFVKNNDAKSIQEYVVIKREWSIEYNAGQTGQYELTGLDLHVQEVKEKE